MNQRVSASASPAEKLCLFIAVGFGSGWAPKAPGTFGTLVGLPLAWGLQQVGNLSYQALAIVALAAIGIPIINIALRALGRGKDPGCIVFDEIVAVPMTFFLVPMTSWFVVVSGFILFRIFDISKLPPAKQLEQLPDGLGVMADDWAAAVYSNLALHLLLWTIPLSWTT